jgi:hypothetical protein
MHRKKIGFCIEMTNKKVYLGIIALSAVDKLTLKLRQRDPELLQICSLTVSPLGLIRTN